MTGPTEDRVMMPSGSYVSGDGSTLAEIPKSLWESQGLAYFANRFGLEPERKLKVAREFGPVTADSDYPVDRLGPSASFLDRICKEVRIVFGMDFPMMLSPFGDEMSDKFIVLAPRVQDEEGPDGKVTTRRPEKPAIGQVIVKPGEAKVCPDHILVVKLRRKTIDLLGTETLDKMLPLDLSEDGNVFSGVKFNYSGFAITPVRSLAAVMSLASKRTDAVTLRAGVHGTFLEVRFVYSSYDGMSDDTCRFVFTRETPNTLDGWD